MNIAKAFDEIYKYTHFLNWSADWDILRKIYNTCPDSYSVLTPFAYSYLEELIRSTTSEYGRELYDENGDQKKFRKVGIQLVKLAIEENKLRNPEYVILLASIKKYFTISTANDIGDNRNSVHHGYMHPKYWNKESFEKLIIDIAIISKYSKF